jgi:hypothetical protein
MIAWYCDNGLVLQAATLMREWLVAFACGNLDKDPLTQGRGVGLALNALADREWKGDERDEIRLWEEMRKWRTAEILGRLWSQVRDLRNDLAHCGMNAQPASADSLARRTTELSRQLPQLLEDAAP